MPGYYLKTLYTQDERDSIVNYIIAHSAYFSLKGNTFWKEMEEAKICTRTWQSMKSHFKTNIAPNLKFYKIPQDEKDRILAAYYHKLENKETKIPVETGEVSSTTNVREKRKRTIDFFDDSDSDETITKDKAKPKPSCSKVVSLDKPSCSKDIPNSASKSFSESDDEKIIMFLKNNIDCIHYNDGFYKKLIATCSFNRSVDSVKKRFLNTILPNLHNYKCINLADMILIYDRAEKEPPDEIAEIVEERASQIRSSQSSVTGANTNTEQSSLKKSKWIHCTKSIANNRSEGNLNNNTQSSPDSRPLRLDETNLFASPKNTLNIRSSETTKNNLDNTLSTISTAPFILRINATSTPILHATDNTEFNRNNAVEKYGSKFSNIVSASTSKFPERLESFIEIENLGKPKLNEFLDLVDEDGNEDKTLVSNSISLKCKRLKNAETNNSVDENSRLKSLEINSEKDIEIIEISDVTDQDDEEMILNNNTEINVKIEGEIVRNKSNNTEIDIDKDNNEKTVASNLVSSVCKGMKNVEINNSVDENNRSRSLEIIPDKEIEIIELSDVSDQVDEERILNNNTVINVKIEGEIVRNKSNNTEIDKDKDNNEKTVVSNLVSSVCKGMKNVEINNSVDENNRSKSLEIIPDKEIEIIEISDVSDETMFLNNNTEINVKVEKEIVQNQNNNTVIDISSESDQQNSGINIEKHTKTGVNISRNKSSNSNQENSFEIQEQTLKSNINASFQQNSTLETIKMECEINVKVEEEIVQNQNNNTVIDISSWSDQQNSGINTEKPTITGVNISRNKSSNSNQENSFEIQELFNVLNSNINASLEQNSSLETNKMECKIPPNIIKYLFSEPDLDELSIEKPTITGANIPQNKSSNSNQQNNFEIREQTLNSNINASLEQNSLLETNKMECETPNILKNLFLKSDLDKSSSEKHTKTGVNILQNKSSNSNQGNSFEIQEHTLNNNINASLEQNSSLETNKMECETPNILKNRFLEPDLDKSSTEKHTKTGVNILQNKSSDSNQEYSFEIQEQTLNNNINASLQQTCSLEMECEELPNVSQDLFSEPDLDKSSTDNLESSSCTTETNSEIIRGISSKLQVISKDKSIIEENNEIPENNLTNEHENTLDDSSEIFYTCPESVPRNEQSLNTNSELFLSADSSFKNIQENNETSSVGIYIPGNKNKLKEKDIVSPGRTVEQNKKSYTLINSIEITKSSHEIEISNFPEVRDSSSNITARKKEYFVQEENQISINENVVSKKRIVKEFSNANLKKFRTMEHNKCLGFHQSDTEKSKSIVSKIHETVEYLRSEIMNIKSNSNQLNFKNTRISNVINFSSDIKTEPIGTLHLNIYDTIDYFPDANEIKPELLLVESNITDQLSIKSMSLELEESQQNTELPLSIKVEKQNDTELEIRQNESVSESALSSFDSNRSIKYESVELEELQGNKLLFLKVEKQDEELETEQNGLFYDSMNDATLSNSIVNDTVDTSTSTAINDLDASKKNANYRIKLLPISHNQSIISNKSDFSFSSNSDIGIDVTKVIDSLNITEEENLGNMDMDTKNNDALISTDVHNTFKKFNVLLSRKSLNYIEKNKVNITHLDVQKRLRNKDKYHEEEEVNNITLKEEMNTSDTSNESPLVNVNSVLMDHDYIPKRAC